MDMQFLNVNIQIMENRILTQTRMIMLLIGVMVLLSQVHLLNLMVMLFRSSKKIYWEILL